MRKIINVTPFLLMLLFFALTFFQEYLNLNRIHLFAVLAFITMINIVLIVFEYKKYGDTKLAFWNSLDFIIFIITSLLDTLGIIEFKTYVAINLVVDGIDFWLEEKLVRQSEDG